MIDHPIYDAGIAGRASLLTDICRAALEASDTTELEAEACRLLAAGLGVGVSGSVEPSPPPDVRDVIAAPIPERDGESLVARGATPFAAEDEAFVASVAGLIGAAMKRLRMEAELRASEQRMLMAQHIAQMGSYDWEIATDTNTWNDELYRIYGTEPQSFNASYEKFLSFIHPDDRESIAAIHRRAYETGEPYQMEERIVRPDGETRILRSNGEVIRDTEGRPTRMIGVCMDVTDQRRAEEASLRSSERFRALVESAPDGVLVVEADGLIVQANRQASVLFGYDVDELLGMNVDELLPPNVRRGHAAHRATFLKDPKPRPMGTQLDISARRKDGSAVHLDVALGVIRTGDTQLVAAFARDATPRREAEAAKRSLLQVDQRRRQALEINDNVVQGLVAALTAIEAGRFDLGAEAVARTLQSARSMMNDLLGEGTAMQPGELVRRTPAESHLASPRHEPAAPERTDPPEAPGALDPIIPEPRRVVIADDSDDLRFLLRMLLSRSDVFDVVAEAADGLAAVDAVKMWQPDVILLDLAMPRMDGLEAVPAIREASPNTRIVVLSGFDSARMSGAATDAGADAYLEKGTSMTDIASTLVQICERGPVARAS
ncbi:MAG TPA: PAS domain S-box protein [Actinomycetota bacterium]